MVKKTESKKKIRFHELTGGFAMIELDIPISDAEIDEELERAAWSSSITDVPVDRVLAMRVVYMKKAYERDLLSERS